MKKAEAFMLYKKLDEIISGPWHFIVSNKYFRPFFSDETRDPKKDNEILRPAVLTWLDVKKEMRSALKNFVKLAKKLEIVKTDLKHDKIVGDMLDLGLQNLKNTYIDFMKVDKFDKSGWTEITELINISLVLVHKQPYYKN